MAASGLVLNPADVECFSSPAYTPSNLPGNSAPRVEAIQIFLATLGSNNTVIPMRILSSDTVASVKMRIQAFKGFYTTQQRLVYGGRELTGDHRSLMKDCGVCSGEVVHLVLRLSDLVDVKVKTVTGTEYTFKLRRSQQVKYLKQQISEKEGGLALDEQQLVFRGKRLEDSKRILDLRVEDDVVIHLVVRKSATVRSKSLGKDIELSVTAAELDSVIDNFSPASIHKSPLAIRTDSPAPAESRYLPFSDRVPKSAPAALPCVQPGNVLPNDGFSLDPVTDFVVAEIPDALLKILQQARSGLLAGREPILAIEGSGGTYFMKDDAFRNVAVFKPVDEEPEAVNNPRSSPRSNSNEGLKSGIVVGEGAMREVAAYLLDHPFSGPRTSFNRNEEGFAGVPPTMMVRSAHRVYSYSSPDEVVAKLGSFQQYIDAVSNCEDMGPANFSVDEVHKISVLDMRLANTDRNGGNILVSKRGQSSAKLVPIDHGYCLPSKFEDCTFEWLYWAQAKVPFKASTLEYIAKLSADEDIAILGSHGIVLRPECARVMRVATMVLQKGAAAGLTPFEIGCMMSREDLDTKSLIEMMLEIAEGKVALAASEDEFMCCLSGILDQHLGQ